MHVFNRYLKKQSLDMENKKVKTVRRTPKDNMENGVNGRLVRDCALLNVIGITEIYIRLHKVR